VRTWVSFIAISGALQAAVERGDLVSYQIKGGVALELRFPGIVRATRDLDVGMPGSRTGRVDGFGAALTAGFDKFTFRIKREPLHMERADTVRLKVAIEYEGRPFQTIDVDLGPAEAPAEAISATIDVIDALAVPMANPIMCLAMSAQIAQKMHAGTNPSIIRDPTKDRGRDIVDVVLLETLGQIDTEDVRVAAEQLFAARREHAWPPLVPEYPVSWLSTMQSLSLELKLAESGAEIVRRFSLILTRVMGVVAMPSYEYQFINVPLADPGGMDAVPSTHPTAIHLAELAKKGWRISTILANSRNSGFMVAVLERVIEGASG
jgi:Nucleotidyl transferase AbiEii toxin, Type IV TA system